MNTIVGVYESHDDAVNAVKTLEKAGYATKNISLISKAELIDDHIHVKSEHTVEKAEVGVGIAADGRADARGERRAQEHGVAGSKRISECHGSLLGSRLTAKRESPSKPRRLLSHAIRFGSGTFWLRRRGTDTAAVLVAVYEEATTR